MGLIVYTVYSNVNQGNEIMLELSEILRRLDDRNLTVVAKKIGVTRVYLSNIKNGRVVPSEKIQMLLSLYLKGAQ